MSELLYNGEMIKIKLTKFRCINQLEIKIQIGSISLIKGRSGVGKTTIFQGILWCLYGNIRMVTPNGEEKAKTAVRIEMPYNLNGKIAMLSIERQKNPNRFLVGHNNQCYEDKVGQAIVNDVFGNVEVWMASCYIGQGCRNSFLTSPNAGKMELLNNIAFHEEDPSIFIDKIEEKIKQVEELYNNKLEIFNQDLNKLNQLIKNTDASKALTDSQINQIRESQKNIEIEIKKHQEIKQEREINLKMLQNLQLEVDCINQPILKQPEDSLVHLSKKYNTGNLQDIDMDTLDNLIEHVTKISYLIEKRDVLINDISQIEKTIPIDIENNHYTLDDYNNALSQEILFNENKQIAEKFKINYQQEEINDSINHYKKVLAVQETLKLQINQTNLLAIISNIQSEINNLPQQVTIPEDVSLDITEPDYSKYSTEILSQKLNNLSKQQGALQSHLSHLEKGKNILQCPSCNISLRYNDGNLSVSDLTSVSQNNQAIQQELLDINNEIINISTQIKMLSAQESQERKKYESAVSAAQIQNNKITQHRNSILLQKQKMDFLSQKLVDSQLLLENVVNQLKTLPPVDSSLHNYPLLSASETTTYITYITTLLNIKFPLLPQPTSKQIQSSINYQKIIENYNEIKKSHNNHLLLIPDNFRHISLTDIQLFIHHLKLYAKNVKKFTDDTIAFNTLKSNLDLKITNLKQNLHKDPTITINNLSDQLRLQSESLILSDKAHFLISQHKNVTSQQESVYLVHSDLTRLHQLRKYAIDTECQVLQQIVHSINNTIEGVCTTLFDRDINIMLNLSKTLKTTRKIKHVVNFSISYQGGLFDDINQMSGGEGDRASLALTLALNRLSSCPLLIFDESLASLDLTMKESSLRTIREHTNNTVLIVIHDGIEGLFDHIIDLDDLLF